MGYARPLPERPATETETAERHYVGLVRGIPPTAKTLKAAMDIEKLPGKVVAKVTAMGAKSASANPVRAISKRA